MKIFRIADGRKDFFQWDSRQSLIIENYIPLCNQVHFCNGSTSEALVVEVKEENGIRYCDVPNILLQEAGQIRCYTFSINNGFKTTHESTFNVIARKKPSSYVYEETEVLNYGVLSKRLTDIESKLLWNNIVTELPKPSEEYRGRFLILTNGEDDTLYLCLKILGIYRWIENGDRNWITSILNEAVLGNCILGA